MIDRLLYWPHEQEKDEERASDPRRIREGTRGGGLRICRVDLPLTVLALSVKGGRQEGDLRWALDVLRTADLIAQPEGLEVLIAPPTTAAAAAQVVEERLRETFPNATFGVAPYKGGDTAGNLLDRARGAA